MHITSSIISHKNEQLHQLILSMVRLFFFIFSPPISGPISGRVRSPGWTHRPLPMMLRHRQPVQKSRNNRQSLPGSYMPGKRESSILFIYTAESILFGRKNPLQGIGFLMKLCFQNTGCIHIVEPEIYCGNIGMPRVCTGCTMNFKTYPKSRKLKNTRRTVVFSESPVHYYYYY